MNEAHLLAAARYVERNPVRARLRTAPRDWPWSSARSHLEDHPDGLTERRPLLDLIADWAGFLAGDDAKTAYQRLRAGERTGRPLADGGLIDRSRPGSDAASTAKSPAPSLTGPEAGLRSGPAKRAPVAICPQMRRTLVGRQRMTYRAISVAMTAFSVFTLGQGEARADMVFVEPDAVADGADLTFSYPGVVLTVDGEPDRVVQAAVGFSEFNGRNLATTGVLVFNQEPPAPGGAPAVVPLTFAFDAGIDPLRADFLVPTDYVQIDIACDDDDFGEILAFDASDNLLATSNRVTCDGRTSNANGTAVISRSTADIAYVIAGGVGEGVGAEALLLDNLQFNLFTPTCDVELNQEIYFEGETITADVFRLVNTSSSQVPVAVKAWVVTAGMAPLEVTSLRRNISRLEPGSDEDFGPVRLAKVESDMPIGPGQIICRLIDSRNGGVYDVEVAPFEIQ